MLMGTSGKHSCGMKARGTALAHMTHEKKLQLHTMKLHANAAALEALCQQRRGANANAKAAALSYLMVVIAYHIISCQIISYAVIISVDDDVDDDVDVVLFFLLLLFSLMLLLLLFLSLPLSLLLL